MDSTTQSREQVQKRFESIKSTPESIQTIAVWVSHHRGRLPIITEVWTHVYKSSDDNRRLSLFYLVNELCQMTKMKENSDLFSNAFFLPILTALEISKSNNELSKKYARVIDIFEQRRTFNSEQVARMRAAQEEEDVTDFDWSDLPTEVERYRNSSIAGLKGQKLLSHEDFSFLKHIKPRITDRKEGQKMLDEMDEHLDRARVFTGYCDQHTERTAALITTLEKAKRLFTVQFRNTNVVEDAYKSYLKRISYVKHELSEMKRTGIYPGATPPRDAPSPKPTDDPFASGVEYAYQHMRTPFLRDNVETMDMEMDDDDNDDRRQSLTNQHSYGAPPVIPTARYTSPGNGVPAPVQNQMYIPTPIPTAPSPSGYAPPQQPQQQQQQMRFSPPPAPYIPRQHHFNPSTAPTNRFQPTAPKKPEIAPMRGHVAKDDGNRPQQQFRHNTPAQPGPPKGIAGNANAIPLGATRGGGPSSQSWRSRLNDSSETGYRAGQKRPFDSRNDFGGREPMRHTDDRRGRGGGRRY